MAAEEALTPVAEDLALAFEVAGTGMLFAFGPPTPADPPGQRMQQVLRALDSEIGAIRWGDQVHGRVVASLAAEPERPLEGAACVGRCDALITADVGLGLVVWTADCVPVLIAGDGVVAAVHSGWRGSVADVVGAVVRRFAIEYGVPAEKLRAILGPAISGPRYEVSREVIDGLRAFGHDEDRWLLKNHVDLRGFLSARLEDLRLDPAAIQTVGPCTASTLELASYRRDGVDAGRQWSMIYRIASSY
jgi:YfiH family protein